MPRARDILVAAGLLLIAAPLAGAGQGGKLTVEITGFHSDQGQLLFRLYDGEAGYPADGTKAVRQVKQSIKNGRAVVELPDLPFGAYAVGCVHDENGNGKLDTNFVGIPREGVCASNDAKGHMGPPKWKDARFDFKPGGEKILIHMAY